MPRNQFMFLAILMLSLFFISKSESYCPKNEFVQYTDECFVCPSGSHTEEIEVDGDTVQICLCEADNNYFDIKSLTCKACPAGSEAIGLECECGSKKFFNQETGKCEESIAYSCKANEFFNAYGDFTCKKCPDGSTSPKGSMECTCSDDKFWDYYHGKCISCPSGSKRVKRYEDEYICNCTDSNQIYDELSNTCNKCPDNSERGDYDYCYCNDGFFGSYEADVLKSCKECPSGTDENGRCKCSQGKYFSYISKECKNFPDNAEEDAENYYGFSCKGNYYYDEYNEKCTACPSGATPETDGYSCICPSGKYWKRSTNKCIDTCTGGKINKAICKECPSGSISLGGTECICKNPATVEFDSDLGKCVNSKGEVINESSSRFLKLELMLLAFALFL